MKKTSYNPAISEIEIWGVVLLLIPFISLLLATATLLARGNIAIWMFPTATALSLAIGHLLIGRYTPHTHAHHRYYLVVLPSILFALISSAILYDNSFDGNTYHQGAIIDMLAGCNPYYHPEQIDIIWGRHYAKALEIAASTIAIFFNRIECGKAVNIMLIQASLFIAYSFLRRRFAQLSLQRTLLITTLITLCPTVIRQAYIYYTDYALYTFMLLAIIALITLYSSNNPLSWCILAISVIFATSTKFTIAFYLYLTIATAIVWYYVTNHRQQSIRLTIAAAIFAIIGFGIIGYHPYITNTIGWGNPFYPLIGGNVDIMTSNTPELYLEGNRVSNWFRSLFYNAQGSGIWIPFVSDSLHDYYISYDSRIAGFGPFFGYVLFASIALMALTLYKQKHYIIPLKHQAYTYIILSAILLVACFVFEQSWWMRYTPFLWAVPIILLLYTELDKTLSPALQAVRNILYSLLVVTQALCCATTIVAGISYAQRMEGMFNAITPQSTIEVYNLNDVQSINHKLCERDIKFSILKEGEEPSDSTLQLVVFPEKANIYLDNDTYNRMQHPDMLDIILGNK